MVLMVLLACYGLWLVMALMVAVPLVKRMFTLSMVACDRSALVMVASLRSTLVKVVALRLAKDRLA